MEKIQAIIDWPIPNNVTELRGFLRVCTYYQRFFKGFSQLEAPLTDLTKKEALCWSKEADFFFEFYMKMVMSIFLVLSLPHFTQPFVLECDSSREGIGEVLMKNRNPVSFE